MVAQLWKKFHPRTLHVSLIKEQGLLSYLHQLFAYQISFTKLKHSKQKLTSCVISIIPNVVTENVHGKNRAVECDLCKLQIHIKFNNCNYLDYRYLQNCDESWYCIECCSTIFPFNSLSSNKKFLACCTNTDSNIIQWKDLENDHASSLSLKPSSNLELLVNQFSNATPENSNDPEKISSSKIMTLKKCITLKYLTIINRYPCSI